ncbi:MAG: HAD-IA family hydrolase [Halobacteriota archaeon]
MHFRDIDVVVFDAMGVTFVEGDDVSNLLIPFVARECGCTNGDAIRQLYLPASLGRISSHVFWARLGCAPACERAYLDTQLKLDPDFVAVAERLKKHYVLAMLSNDVSEWSAYLRRRFVLDRLFTSVVISGDYGFRKPDRRLYQILLRSLNVAPHRCVFVDDQPRNLETAAQLRMHTVCRIRDNRDPPIYERAVESLNDLLTLL